MKMEFGTTAANKALSQELGIVQPHPSLHTRTSCPVGSNVRTFAYEDVRPGGFPLEPAGESDHA